MDEKALKHLREEAVHILRKNDTGRFTKPAPRLYPHQWNWDSVFNAIGWLHIDEDRAWLELDSLLTGQWKHGMVPHIVFDPEIDAYHPGPDYWNTSVSPMAPDHVLTSGITQPPLLAYGTWYIFQRARYKDKALQWLKRLYPRIRAFHDFLHAKRDMEGKGVVAILHPW